MVCTEIPNLFREISVSFGKFYEISVKFRSFSESSVSRNFGKITKILCAEIYQILLI